MSQQVTNNQSKEALISKNKFFNLHTTGIGYLGRLREVPVKRGVPFLAVNISALHGSSEDVQYTRFDCRVSGEEARKTLQTLMPQIYAGTKILVSFKIGDLYPDQFVHETGEKAGQPGVSLKARLLKIKWVKIDGKLVWRSPQNDDEAYADADAADADAADISAANSAIVEAPADFERSSLNTLI